MGVYTAPAPTPHASASGSAPLRIRETGGGRSSSNALGSGQNMLPNNMLA